MRSTDMDQGGREVVGWGAVGAPWTVPGAPSVSRALALALHEAGVREAFGVLGGGNAPFAAGLVSTPIRFYHCRHEAGAGFAAIEGYFATGRPGVAMVTTGPGLFNVLNPAMAARVDGAKLLVVSGFTSPALVGRGAVQETCLRTMPAELARPGSIFHEVALPSAVEELPDAIGRIARGLAGPGGFVAHLGLSLALQTRILAEPLHTVAAAPWSLDPPAPSEAAIDACLAALADPSAAIWAGFGAREASAALRRFAERARMPVLTSPRGKGVFPEMHPLFVGVSGAGGSPAVREWFRRRRPQHLLVLGTRLGEVTSFLSPDHTPLGGWTHVDLDPTAFGAAFPQVRGRGVIADVGRFLAALLARAEATGWFERRVAPPVEERPVPTRLSPRADGDVRQPYLMQALQEHVVKATDAIVMSEAGTSFTWCNAGLRFEAPGRYRTSAAWGSMGHFTTGCVGAALAGERRVVAVVGDGAMLMNNEINTAVQYGARVMWVILNDAQLGLNEQGMSAQGMRPVATQMPRTDFVAFARSQGADGSAVAREADLPAALARGLAHDGPFVLDVRVDRTIVSPVIADRALSLRRQAGTLAPG